MMRQLTVRGFDEELSRSLRQLARTRGISLNRAALLLLRRGAGLEEETGGPDVVGSALDQFIGSWAEEQAEELLEAVTACEQIDEEFWH
jgi:hypothetical protein